MTADEARALRERLGISQNQVARHIEVHPPFGGARSYSIHTETISRYERGRMPVPQWYADVLYYLNAQPLGENDYLVVTFPTKITKCHLQKGAKVEW
jgi:transcriptional regulator with XRE-family HTH domain